MAYVSCTYSIAQSILDDVVFYLHTLKNSRLCSIVVTSIHDTDGFRPSLLRGSDSGPEYSFTTTTSVTFPGRQHYSHTEFSEVLTKTDERIQ